MTDVTQPNDDLLIATDGTASDSLTQGSVVATTAEDTGTTGIPVDRIRVYAAGLRDEVELLASDVTGLHHETQDYDLRQRAQVKARLAGPTLLSHLAVERGMTWSNIARLIGVTVPAVRKWRAGGKISGENRLALARLAAFLDLLEEFCVEDPAGWLEVPLAHGYAVTAIDLYRAGKESDLLDLASTRLSVEQVLDRYDSGWRETHRTEFEVFEAPDGDLAIRLRRQEG